MSDVHARYYAKDCVLPNDLQTAISNIDFIGDGCGSAFDDIAWTTGMLVGTERLCELITSYESDTLCLPIPINWKVALPGTPPQYYFLFPGKRIACGELVPKTVTYRGFDIVVTPKFRFDASKVGPNEHFFRPVFRESTFVVSDALRQAIVDSKMRKCKFRDPSDMEVLW